MEPFDIYNEYFFYHEFDSPDRPGTGVLMEPTFLERLTRAREKTDLPFIITSGYRSAEHNEEVGGVPDSAHCKGLAVDIKVVNARQRARITMALIRAGFSRIGLGKSFIHVDSDPKKPSPALWWY